MQLPGMKQDITEIWVSMARRQVLNMAHAIANKSSIPVHWADKGKNTLKFGKREEAPKKKAKKKGSDEKKMLKSWREVLAI